MGQILAFTNQKGGVGKTTTCVNLAAYLANDGFKVLLIDMDPQGNASSGLGHINKKKGEVPSLYDVLSDEIEATDAIVSTEIETLKLLSSSLDLAGAEMELAGITIGRERILSEKLTEIKDIFDFILIDCPPSLGLLTVNALTASDGVVIPIQCEYYALEGLAQMMNTIRLVKKFLNPSLDVAGVVMTLYDGRSKLSKDVAAEIENVLGDKVFETKIPRNIRLAEAPSFGKPILLHDKRCIGAKQYENLKDEFLKRIKR